MRQWVYCNGLRYGTVADYDFLWAKYLESNVANDQLVMLSAAGCTLHQPSLNRFLANIASGSYNNFNVRPQDYSAAISSAITSNEENTWRVFQWLQTNVNFLRANAYVKFIVIFIFVFLILTLFTLNIEQTKVLKNNSSPLGAGFKIPVVRVFDISQEVVFFFFFYFIIF